MVAFKLVWAIPNFVFDVLFGLWLYVIGQSCPLMESKMLNAKDLGAAILAETFSAKIAKTEVIPVKAADLPQESIMFLLAYGVRQYLADGGASEKEAAAKIAAAKERLADLIAGDFTRKSGTAGVGIETIAARNVMRVIFKAKADKAKLTAYKEADADGRNAMLDAMIAKNADVIAGLVAENIEKLKAEALERDSKLKTARSLIIAL